MKPRRRKRSPVARVRPFWVPIAIGAAIIAGLLVIAASWPGFDAKYIIVAGNRRVSRHEILAHAAIAPHLSIWLQNTHAIGARIDAIPYVASASVRRMPPSSIRIHISERVPFAVLRSGDESAIVDHSLRVLEPAVLGSALPVLLVSPGYELVPGDYVQTSAAVELRSAYDVIAARRLFPVQLQLDRFGGLVATMRGGLRLLLGGTDDLGRKLTLADAILAQVMGGQQRRVAALDLRAPSAPVLVYR